MPKPAFRFLNVVGVSGVLVVVGALSGQTPPKAEPPVEKARTIPLDSCIATRGVGGCKLISEGGDEPYVLDLREMFREHRAGASNVALVRGKDIAAAVKATRSIFTAGLRADVPAQPDAIVKPDPHLWLVAYFGTGPSEPGFGRVLSAEARRESARITYTRARITSATDDVRHYYLWVPLGQARAGTYSLELFDSVRNEVTLLRRVAVGAP